MTVFFGKASRFAGVSLSSLTIMWNVSIRKSRQEDGVSVRHRPNKQKEAANEASKLSPDSTVSAYNPCRPEKNRGRHSDFAPFSWSFGTKPAANLGFAGSSNGVIVACLRLLHRGA
jgi:hypothetical protein